MEKDNKRLPAHSGRAAMVVVLLAAIGGCQLPPTGGAAANVAVSIELEPETRPWQAVITPADGQRLQRIDAAWSEALADARRLGHGRRIAAEGVLLEPGARLPRAELAPGTYRCRIIRLGGAERRRAFTAFEPYFCYVGAEGDLLSLTKQTGSERQGGFLWADGRDRMIFLGALALGSETRPPAYGQRDDRDLAGVLERVGPFHYRLVMPWPRQAGKLDVLEMIPVVPSG
jgi:hypothetical protein